MTFSLALPKSVDTLSLVAGLEGDNGRKSAGSEGGDGFAELLNQLSSFTPRSLAEAEEGEAKAGERQALELPTGKVLPLSAYALPELSVEAQETDAAKTDPEMATAMPADLPQIGLLQVAMVVSGDKAGDVAAKSAGAAIATGTSPASHLPDAAKPPEVRATVAGPAPAKVTGDQPVEGLQVRIAAAAEPREARLPGMSPQVEGGKARLDLSTSTTDAAARTRPAEAAPAALRPFAGQVVAAAAQSVAGRGSAADAGSKLTRSEAGQASPAPAAERPAAAAQQATRSIESVDLTASASDRKAGEQDTAGDKMASAVRSTPAIETAKFAPQVLAARIDEGATVAPTLTSASRPVVSDPFANVERVVEHIMAARQTDLTKPAAIAVAHKEFGSLTVTFDQSANGMNVEIAADDREAQRALAAAMANDRGALRQQDSPAQSATTTNQSAQPGGERGGTTNTASSGTGQGGGDDQRSQHAEQRGRQGERGAAKHQSPAQARPDDGLYA